MPVQSGIDRAWNRWQRSRIHSGSREGGKYMEERLKSLMHDLGNAINDSLSESDRIAEAIGEIKQAGFDVFLVLEATIGFNRREEKPREADADTAHTSTAKIRFTSHDQRFLKAMKIAVEEPHSESK